MLVRARNVCKSHLKRNIIHSNLMAIAILLFSDVFFYWFNKISTCDLNPDKTTPIFLFTLACAHPASGKSQKTHFLCLPVQTEKNAETFLKRHESSKLRFFAVQTGISPKK